jgi:hypothetical protein
MSLAGIAALHGVARNAPAWREKLWRISRQYLEDSHEKGIFKAPLDVRASG